MLTKWLLSEWDGECLRHLLIWSQQPGESYEKLSPLSFPVFFYPSNHQPRENSSFWVNICLLYYLLLHSACIRESCILNKKDTGWGLEWCIRFASSPRPTQPLKSLNLPKRKSGKESLSFLDRLGQSSKVIFNSESFPSFLPCLKKGRKIESAATKYYPVKREGSSSRKMEAWDSDFAAGGGGGSR